MTDELFLGDETQQPEAGCSFAEVNKVSGAENISICHVKVSDIQKIADELSKTVMDFSWMMEIDKGSKRAYRQTAEDTAKELVKIFKNILTADGKVSGEFGEIMVSMGSSRALEVIFSHNSLPIAEFWKPQVKGNEGFDFHTICPENIINFGEAKFASTTKNPYGGSSGKSDGAAGQADGFFEKEKHLRDRVHLINLVDEEAIKNLDDDNFGVVLAFSMNSSTPLNIYNNAIESVSSYPELMKAKKIYIVGVSHGT